MNRNLIFVLLIIFCFYLNGCDGQQDNNSLNLISTIPLPDVSGRIDHLSFDSKNQILFVAALGNNSVEVVDLKSQKVIHSIKNLNEPQGVVFMAGRNSVFIANGENGECDLVDVETFQKTNSIKLSGDADNVRYDEENSKIYVGYGDGGIAIIDEVTFNLITEVQLAGHPESFQLDHAAKKIYVNVPDEKQIEVIELETNKVTDKWKMTEATSNFPMCLDEVNHRLFIGCRYAPKLLIIDTQTGKTISSFPIDRDVDDIFYNSSSHEIYLSCGGGYIDVFQQKDADTYMANGKVDTRAGSRTSLFIPELNQLVVASPAGIHGGASLLVYNTN